MVSSLQEASYCSRSEQNSSGQARGARTAFTQTLSGQWWVRDTPKSSATTQLCSKAITPAITSEFNNRATWERLSDPQPDSLPNSIALLVDSGKLGRQRGKVV